jgi:hypothetical protein
MVFEILITLATKNGFTWIVALFREHTKDSEIYTSVVPILRAKIEDFSEK